MLALEQFSYAIMMKKNKKMNIVLVITAIILTVIMFYILKWAILTSVGSLMHAGAVVLVLLGILAIATLSFSAILIVAIFKCESLASLFVVWGVTIFIYSIYPIAVVIEKAHKEAMNDLEAEFYSKIQNTSVTWEEFDVIVNEIERKAADANSFCFWLVRNNKSDIVFTLVYNKRFDFVDKMIEQGHDITTYNMAAYLNGAYHMDSDKDSVSHLGQIQFLLSRGCDINATDSWNGNSLEIALSNRDEQSAQYLLDEGIDFNKPSDKTSLLAIAAYVNNISMVKQLLAKGIDVNEANALTYCAGYANLDVVKFLLDNGADINAKGFGGETALMIAIQYNDIEVAELLLGRGADPNILNNSGYDAISEIASATALGEEGEQLRDKGKLLIKAGAILNRTYPNGKTLGEMAEFKGLGLF